MQQGEQAETERDYHQDELSQAGQDQQASDDQSMVSEDQEQNDNVQGRENEARYNQPSSEELHQRLAASRAELAEDQQQSEAGNEQEQVDEQDDNLNR